MSDIEQKIELDKKDRRILAVLQQRGNIPNNELADLVNLSPSTCLRRVKRLEELGVIRGYVALLDAAKIGRSLCVFVRVKLDHKSRADVERFEAEVLKYPEVTECHVVMGEDDFILKIVVADLNDFQKFLLDHLTAIQGLGTVISSAVLRQVKSTTELPI